jgi:r-opsin
MNIKSLTYKKTLFGVLLCILLGLVSPLMPLFGWSYYSIEENKIFCSIEWRERSFNVISYNVFVFFIVFFIPLIIIIICSTKTIIIVSKIIW